jgi:ribosomal protein S8
MAIKKAAGARKAPAKTTAAARALVEGYRSGLEAKIANQLEKAGYVAHFETLKIPFTQPVKPRSYTPDFPLENGIVIETKGRFMSDDRVKHKLIKDQYPDLDIRFVFSNSRTKLSKGSLTTYGAWCTKHGFKYADTSIPIAWLEEPPEETRMNALAAIAVPTTKSTT